LKDFRSALLSRVVARNVERASRLVRAEIGGATAEIVVDSRQANAGIDRGRSGTKLEIEVRGLVERARIRSRGRDFYKDIEVDQDAMRVLTGRLAVLLERLEAAPLPG
jgi:hypothetical protein